MQNDVKCLIFKLKRRTCIVNVFLMHMTELFLQNNMQVRGESQRYVVVRNYVFLITMRPLPSKACFKVS